MLEVDSILDNVSCMFRMFEVKCIILSLDFRRLVINELFSFRMVLIVSLPFLFVIRRHILQHSIRLCSMKRISYFDMFLSHGIELGALKCCIKL
jgi:hypothetical protein